MREIAAWAALAALLVAYYLFSSAPHPSKPVLRSPCEATRFYAIDAVDSRFQLSSYEVRSALEEAASIWNATQRKPLLAHDPAAKLRVSFVYDERQELDARMGEIKETLSARESGMKPRVEDLNNRARELDKRMKALKERVEDLNARGGAPPLEIAAIRQEETLIQESLRRLRSQQAAFQIDAESFKQEGKAYAETVDSFNQAIGAKPEQGLYDGAQDRIAINFGGSRAEFVHTAAHEFGHALGLLHTADRAGIMHANSSESLALSEDDRRALADLCRSRTPYAKNSSMQP